MAFTTALFGDRGDAGVLLEAGGSLEALAPRAQTAQKL